MMTMTTTTMMMMMMLMMITIVFKMIALFNWIEIIIKDQNIILHYHHHILHHHHHSHRCRHHHHRRRHHMDLYIGKQCVIIIALLIGHLILKQQSKREYRPWLWWVVRHSAWKRWSRQARYCCWQAWIWSLWSSTSPMENFISVLLSHYWRMHAWSGSGGSLILPVWNGVFCLLRWSIRWAGLSWMLTKWLNSTSQPSLLRWANSSWWWLLVSTNAGILGLMLNACVKDAALLLQLLKPTLRIWTKSSMTSVRRLTMHRPPKFMPSTAISEFVQFCPAGFDEVQRLISSPPSSVALMSYQPGFSRNFPSITSLFRPFN